MFLLITFARVLLREVSRFAYCCTSACACALECILLIVLLVIDIICELADTPSFHKLFFNKKDVRRGTRPAYFDGCDVEVGHFCDGEDAIFWKHRNPCPIVLAMRELIAEAGVFASQFLKDKYGSFKNCFLFVLFLFTTIYRRPDVYNAFEQVPAKYRPFSIYPLCMVARGQCKEHNDLRDVFGVLIGIYCLLVQFVLDSHSF